MWEVIPIVAATVVIVWLFQLMDLGGTFIAKLKGRLPQKEIETRLRDLERKVQEMTDESAEQPDGAVTQESAQSAAP